MPQPEVPATRSNPRGHFEPVWVVQFQRRLLSEANVRQADARPHAFALAGQAGAQPATQEELRHWLARECARALELVVKDPRSSWFLPMWLRAADEAGVVPSALLMLRHPAEVVGSKQTYYGSRQHEEEVGGSASSPSINRTANWINLTLGIECASRACPRTLLRYVDLVGDWRAALGRAAEQLDLSIRHGTSPEAAARVDDFVDPNLHRVRADWDQVEAPQRLKDLAQDVWQEMGRLAELGSRDKGSERALDQLRDTYRCLYSESEAIAHSSIQAAQRSTKKKGRRLRQRHRASVDDPAANPGAVSAPPDIRDASLPAR